MKRALIVLVLVIATRGSWASDSNEPPADARKLLAESSLVVVGTVQVQGTVGSTVNVDVHPVRVLQGSGTSPVSASWQLFDQGITLSPTSPTSVYGLIFLSGSNEQGWQLSAREPGLSTNTLEASVVPLPVGPLPAGLQYAATDPLPDKVAAEVWNAARSADDSMAYTAYSFLHPYNLDCVPSLPHSPCAHLANLGASHAASCRSLAIAREWGPSLAARVEQYLRDHPLNVDDVPVPLRGVILSAIHSPKALPALSHILDLVPSGSTLEESVAQALENIHSDEALPLLHRLLDSPNRRTQHAAIRGLAQYVNGAPIGCVYDCGGSHPPRAATDQTRLNTPGPEQFNSSPEPYLAFWRSWYPDQNPMVSISGGGATCHPPAPGIPCTLPLTATASDPNGEALHYHWGGCSTSTIAIANCAVTSLGTVTATATVDDGRGGAATASTTVTGANQTPTFTSVEWSEREPVLPGTEVTARFSVSDDDATPRGGCGVGQVTGACTKKSVRCVGRTIDVTVVTQGSGLCYLEDTFWKDAWGASATSAKVVITVGP